MVMPLAWVLNLDADEELRHPEGYVPTAATTRRVQRFAARLQGLVRPGDVVLEGLALRPDALNEPPPPSGAVKHQAALHAGDARNDAALQGRFVGQAWCPTPSALVRLRRAGALLPATPPLEVLRRVNHRAFCADLGQTLKRARYVRSFEELRRHVAELPISTWVLKRPHGFSGRGSRRIRFPRPDAADLRWIEASLKHDGGLQVEPWVNRLRDFAVHGYIEAWGKVRLGQPTVQECGSRGDWLRTRPAAPADLHPAENSLLRQMARDSAGALYAAGYFGPFGIDAYRWHDDEGLEHFNPRSEINARYTMGWHVGMGDWRPTIGLEGT